MRGSLSSPARSSGVGVLLSPSSLSSLLFPFFSFSSPSSFSSSSPFLPLPPSPLLLLFFLQLHPLPPPLQQQPVTGAAWGLGSGQKGQRGGAAGGPAGAVDLPLLDGDGERRQGATSATTGRGGAAGHAGGAPGRAAWQRARGAAAGARREARQRVRGARRGSGRAARWWRRGATRVHARRWGARGCRARGGQARSGGRAAAGLAAAVLEARGSPGARVGRPGSGQTARAAAGARRRGARRRWWTRGGRPRAGAWGGRLSSGFFSQDSDREFGLRPDAQIPGPRQRFFIFIFKILCRGPQVRPSAKSPRQFFFGFFSPVFLWCYNTLF